MDKDLLDVLNEDEFEVFDFAKVEVETTDQPTEPQEITFNDYKDPDMEESEFDELAAKESDSEAKEVIKLEKEQISNYENFKFKGANMSRAKALLEMVQKMGEAQMLTPEIWSPSTPGHAGWSKEGVSAEGDWNPSAPKEKTDYAKDIGGVAQKGGANPLVKNTAEKPSVPSNPLGIEDWNPKDGAASIEVDGSMEGGKKNPLVKGYNY